MTLDGTPLEGATVFFSPKGTSGIRRRDTQLWLIHFECKGAQPGAGTAVVFSVTVSKVEMPEMPNITEDDPRYGTPEHDRLNQEASTAKPKVIVPEKYNNSETSPSPQKSNLEAIHSHSTSPQNRINKIFAVAFA